MTQINMDRMMEPVLATRARIRAVAQTFAAFAPGRPIGSPGPLASAPTPPYIHTAMTPRPPRRLFEAGAALLGIAAGVLFAKPVLAAGGDIWHGFILPAYDELIKNGVFAWCF